MKKTAIFAFVLSTVLTSAWAQAPRQNYRQFFFNPYLYNSAFAGMSGNTELNVVYKKQLMGFKDAPASVGANLQLPTSSKVVLAFNFTSNTEALLRNTSLTGTFGYVVPIDKKQSLRFGLTGGIGLKRLDLTAEELNTGDPAMLNAAASNYYADGRFGFAYTNAGFRLGIALTELFQSDPFQDEFNKFSIANLQNRIYSASYRFNLDRFERFSLEPYVIYHQSADKVYNAWEAATLAYFKDKLWTGVGYHEQKGVSLFFGMNVMDKMRFSYSYEFPPFQSDAPTFSAHELQLTLRLGKNRDAGQQAYPRAAMSTDFNQ
jgi:type IX secretion system PorP/SprF family membrane protein